MILKVELVGADSGHRCQQEEITREERGNLTLNKEGILTIIIKLGVVNSLLRIKWDFILI